jgi:hypothetical protein
MGMAITHEKRIKNGAWSSPPNKAIQQGQKNQLAFVHSVHLF